jgi:hypothetical protein
VTSRFSVIKSKQDEQDVQDVQEYLPGCHLVNPVSSCSSRLLFPTLADEARFLDPASAG